MKKTKANSTSAPAPAPALETPAPAPAVPAPLPVTAAELNLHVDAPIADEDAIKAISSPELPGQIPGETPPAPAPAPVPVPAPNYTGNPETDAEGVSFNPEIHDAKKEKNADGLWKKKRGRKSGGASVSAPRSSAPESVVGSADTPGQALLPGMEGVAGPDRFDVSAEMYCQTGYAVFGSIFSAPEEWQPDSPAEHENVKRAVASYLRFKQTEDLPPGMALALAIGSFAVPRAMRPKTKATLGKYLGSARSLLVGRRAAPESIPAVAPVAQVSPASEQSENFPT